jgi:ATP-binding cassette subfamily C protein CydD
VLQIAFLSGLVLEVLTTICVALVAVGIGMRLVFGQLDLSVGLAVLILAPEVYLPLRMVGLHFHASSDGIAAAAAALELIDEPLPADRAGVRPGTVLGVGWRDVRVDQPGRGLAAPVGLTATATAGRVLALAGPNGGGKSTAVRALLGLVDPTEGRVVLQVGDGEVDVAEVDPGWWHARVAWVPQHPTIVAATLADNIELLVPGLHTAERDLAAARAGLAQVVAQLPDGWATRVGEGGVGLSAGQRQRLALTRAAAKVHAGAQVVILDEPSAHLDAGTEALVVRTVQEWAERGLVVIVVAHRAGLLAIADQVVEVSASPTCGADR